ncbi:protein-methionine-sulfoxide reductase heme-binding subunit MsrQ [Endozoicomonas sp. G2_1]|uniref:protein-methionine-sulfoxide reductase heme-binding subunit MsrQ n=1 Tax=Endozoicomonas sp. G2_1 TaxID=2821091 RepID=UPI001ADCED50|nr:protein-methionine-sulfoxide reductase heme-binding subunit MsrQ [Endozoicomonas sp. G2_1]MBO9489195.1 protein-methionine-sulfoxide reductase heme-binding subunit MsrQ [Endozoicomonas sp. G2_1]
MATKTKVWLLKTVIHLAALIPLVYTYYLAIIDQLGGDPVEAILHFTGIGALNILLLSLLISPLAKRFKQAYILQTRRLVGLYAFAYALFHILSFLFFEVQFNWQLFVDEIIQRPYITVGMLAFTVLLLLAVTSVSALKRKMGKRWQQLHNWVYPAAILAAVHFYWSVKSELIEPSIYLVMVAVLLALRADKFKRWFR